MGGWVVGDWDFGIWDFSLVDIEAEYNSFRKCRLSI